MRLCRTSENITGGVQAGSAWTGESANAGAAGSPLRPIPPPVKTPATAGAAATTSLPRPLPTTQRITNPLAIPTTHKAQGFQYDYAA